MSQRLAFGMRRVCVALTTVSLVVAQANGYAQANGDAQGLGDASLVSGLRTSSGLSLGGLGMGGAPLTPSIRQDDRLRQEIGTDGVATLQRHSQVTAPPKALPPNEFQKFVQESTGQILPVFGADFFNQPGNVFASQSNTPVGGDYRLGPGDELQIKGWGSVDIDVRAVVDRNGQIHLPKVGTVNLAGVRSSQAEATIRAAVGRYYKDFELSVSQGQLRGITVYVVGQARQPGAYLLSGASTLISALFACGGPNQLGSLRQVQVKRGEHLVTTLDLYDFLAKGDKSDDVKLQDGDTIVIPAAKAHVALIGKVASPAVYELTGDQDSIASVLAVAGGLPVVADPKRAYLERVDPTQKPSRKVESFALDPAGLRKRLQAGDILSVLPLTAEFGNAVTLRGNVDTPVRAPWRDGMKVRDLIPSKAVLMSRASVQRQNGALLDTKDDDEKLAGRIGRLVDEINFEYAVIERIDPASISVNLVPFNLGKALDDPASPENMPLKPGDIVTVFSVNDVRVPQAKRQVFVRVEGEVQRPGIYQMASGDGLSQLIEKAGGLTADAYLFGAAFYREEVRQTQLRNLDQLVRRLEMQSNTKLSASAASVSANTDVAGAAQLRLAAEAKAQEQALQRMRTLKPTGRVMLGLQPGDKSYASLPAIRLESQDRLVIPARPDFVYVLGSVNTEASLLWRPGLTVQHYLDQSGLTNGADKDEMFIVRADGSVVSSSGSWVSGMTRVTVQPGDLIVLPEKTDHESAWSTFTRNAKDVTQIIYQFSLGAAAIKTLRQ